MPYKKLPTHSKIQFSFWNFLKIFFPKYFPDSWLAEAADFRTTNRGLTAQAS